MTARLASSVLVGALVRKAQSEGGFAAVLAKGDPAAGAVLVVLLERGENPRILERSLDGNGEYYWDAEAKPSEEVPQLVDRKKRYDPDLWVLELDIPSAERFAAEINSLD